MKIDIKSSLSHPNWSYTIGLLVLENVFVILINRHRTHGNNGNYSYSFKITHPMLNN